MKTFTGIVSSSNEANIKSVQNGSVKRVLVFTENGVYVYPLLYLLTSVGKFLTVNPNGRR